MFLLDSDPDLKLSMGSNFGPIPNPRSTALYCGHVWLESECRGLSDRHNWHNSSLHFLHTSRVQQKQVEVRK